MVMLTTILKPIRSMNVTSFDVLTKLILEFKILFLQLSNKTNLHLKDCPLYFPQLHAGR